MTQIRRASVVAVAAAAAAAVAFLLVALSTPTNAVAFAGAQRSAALSDSIYTTYTDRLDAEPASSSDASSFAFELLPVMRNRRDVVAPKQPATAPEQPAQQQLPTLTIQSATAEAAGSVQMPPETQRPLLGVNGTGQRKPLLATIRGEMVGLDASASASASAPTTIKPTLVSEPISSDEQMLKTGGLYETVDVPSVEDRLQAEAKKHNLTVLYKDFQFYNSTTYVSPVESQAFLATIQNMSKNSLLSTSHRRAITVELTFDFPFYGHPVRNITVATGGFLYTGDYVHSWLAATQYIAPLMANFDSSISTDSSIRFADNGTAFTVLWENIRLQDLNYSGQFTFSATLHKSGLIVFNYFRIPIEVANIQEDNHPVKIGLSDAYIIDKQIMFARRKTIYEYHRVNFEGHEVTNATIIRIAPNPTCHGFTDCQTCAAAPNTTFVCAWCPATQKCSTGTDRKRQEWLAQGCDKLQIQQASRCPANGTVGNRAGSSSSGEQTFNVPLPAPAVITSATAAVVGATNATKSHSEAAAASAAAAGSRNGGGGGGGHAADVPQQSDLYMHAEAKQPQPEEDVGGFVMFVSVFMPIGLVLSLVMWLFYAYRNPHTKSGQLLIQYRPGQWSWRRSEARYTAATIHM